MFKINVRITENFGILKTISPGHFDREYNHITGFFEIKLGAHNEGSYFHEEPLQEGEHGSELLDWWLNLMLDTVNYLENSKYVAFQEPETFNKWLEFKVENNYVKINLAVDNSQNDNTFIIEPYKSFSYIEPTDYMISLTQLKHEVIKTTKLFLAELGNINPALLKTKMALELIGKILNIQI